MQKSDPARVCDTQLEKVLEKVFDEGDDVAEDLAMKFTWRFWSPGSAESAFWKHPTSVGNAVSSVYGGAFR